MSLYWHASAATEMPLLQYLAYYQVIEFFFPTYSAQEANNIIKRMLKDPSFENNIDGSINRLIAMIKPYIGKGGYSDERVSLKATLKNCLAQEELRSFIEEDGARKKFFTTKEEWRMIASQNIYSENPRTEQDMVDSTALRVYEIRCRIVHTKSTEADTQGELLLPFSKEAQKLQFDIELIKFVSRKVLIASGKQLTLY